MADVEKSKDVQLLKGTTISVFVDEALQDMLVVTYDYGVKIFKGVLLDYTKRNLPHGIPQLNPAFTATMKKEKANPDDDVLYSVNQRFTYMDPSHPKPKNVRIPSKYKINKMTVRLRPRQVLCSKCKGICNENSENVSKKRKSNSSTQLPPSKRSANAPVTRSAYSEQLHNSKKMPQKSQPILIPKLSRLLPQDISNALNGNLRDLSSDGNKKEVKLSTSRLKPNFCDDEAAESSDHSIINHSENVPQESSEIPLRLASISTTLLESSKVIKRTLRKKRSIGSMEDLWDESVFEEGVNLLKSNPNNDIEHCSNTRTIKISYGPQGEGTILKIPAPIEKFNASDDSEENINVADQDGTMGSITDDKAVRKALKRARKKARQRMLVSGNSPSHISAMSPRYSIGGTSPRYSIVGNSKRHCIGSHSPRYVSSSTEFLPKRHKHKLKRKKKHRDEKDKRYKDEEEEQSEDSKDQAVAQKLSINLKRLNNTYTSFRNSDKGEENSSSSDDHNEEAPDFPPSNLPLMLRVNTQTVSSALGADGGRLLVGDVVWGKIHGFPWWPGKVLTITCSGNQNFQAHIAWYGSSTSSLIQCDHLSPYLENFKIRYNKKKRGAYKEAIRQATSDAKENADVRLRKETVVVSSPSQAIMTVPPPALASPREIDVMS